MSDTTMLRVSTELRDKLKAKAKAEGRTLEWTANQALNEFLLPKTPDLPNKMLDLKNQSDANIVKDQQPYRPTHYKETNDWGA